MRALLTYIQGLGATHLFTLDNAGTSTADPLGNILTNNKRHII